MSVGDPIPGRIQNPTGEHTVPPELLIDNASLSLQALLGNVIIDAGWAPDPETGLPGKPFDHAVEDHFTINRRISLDSRHGRGPTLSGGMILPAMRVAEVSKQGHRW